MKFKLILATSVVLIAMLACNLPGGNAPEATATEEVVPLPTETESQAPAATATNSVEAEPTSEPASTDTPETTETCTPDAEFVADVTIPDGTLVEPGATITKTWRIRNNGTCTWTTSYVWEQINFGDGKLNAATADTPLTTEIAPGQTFDLSVDLTLAADAETGSGQVARFQMRTAEGDLFGTHPFAFIFAAAGTGTCPVGNADHATFINVGEHFCFLYPADYDASIGGSGDTIVSGPTDPDLIEDIPPMVSISNEGSTGGQNLADWSDQMVNDWKAPSTTPTVTNIQVNGLDAKQTDELPGQVGNRIVFLVQGGNGYVFTVLPVDDSFPDKTESALDLWEMVSDSFTFFAP